MLSLTESQKAALEQVTSYARRRGEAARQLIREVLQMSDIASEYFEKAVDRVKSNARVALHFHPDRLGPDMKSVAESLLDQGVYKSQFETHISNGSVSAYPGGQRDEWENLIFDGAYRRHGTVAGERPKYGSLDLMRCPDGPSPRFGSCYFLLSPAVSRRCTYTYMDSHENPAEKGTYEAFDDILAALLKEIFLRDYALGIRDLTPRGFVEHLHANLGRKLQDPSKLLPSRNLNHYIEAQVHGDVRLSEDVDILVADPSFKNTNVGEIIEELSRRYSVEVHWHMGFRLGKHAVPSDFRGPSMPSLGARIAKRGFIDAAAIGAAAVDLKRSPESWRDRGVYDEVLQELKLLWHVLVRYGESKSSVS